MKLKRIKTGKRNSWKKGHSCSSNPQSFKFREAAKGAFFQSLDKAGTSELTVEALAEHAAALSVEPKLCVNPEDDVSVGKSFNTFATNFTTCTIPAFEKFFKNFTVESELQTRMLAIHAAAQEYIQDAKLSETSTSYMCALMASLEGIADIEEDVAASLALIAKVIRKVQKEILIAKFAEYSKTFSDILTRYSTSSNTKLLINVIGCLSILLRAQKEFQWTYQSTMNLFQKIVFYATHENPDIRRTAQYNVSAILKASSFISEDKIESDENEKTDEVEAEIEPKTKPFCRSHPAAASLGKFVIANFKIASQDMNGKATLYLLSLLQQVISVLPEKILEQCCSSVLGVMHIGDGIVRSRSLKVFGALFDVDGKEKSVGALTEKTNEALINALISSKETKSSQSLGLVPGINDEDLGPLWMDVVASGIVCLRRANEQSGIERLSSWIEQLTVFWRSDSEVIHEKTWHTIDFLIDECIHPLKERVSSYAPYILAAFRKIEKCVSMQYEVAWPYVFRSLAAFFLILGPLCSAELIPCLKNLCCMIDNPEIYGKRDLENCIGAAVAGMGPEEVMKVVPLQITGNIRVDENNFWILPVLRKHVKNTRLSFFESYFVHLASKCFILLESLKKRNQVDSILGKAYQQVERQIWALFPSFANNPEDLEKALSIQSFAKLICDHIKNREDIRIDVMAALRNLVRSSNTNGKLAFYGKNYLPALFNIYLMKPRNKASGAAESNTIEPSQRLAAFSTIQTYLTIIPASKVLEFFNLIVGKFEKEESDLFRKRSLLELARSFLPYLDLPSLNLIYQKSKTDIESNKSVMQKVAYKILEDIFSLDSSICRNFIEQNMESLFPLLINGAQSLTPNSRAPRLKCITKLLSHLPNYFKGRKIHPILEQVVKEAVQFCGRKYSAGVRSSSGQGGKKCSSNARRAAFSLLLEVGIVIQQDKKISAEDTFHYCLTLLPPLTPPSDLTANVILAKIALFCQYKDLMSPSVLSETITDVGRVLKSGDRNILRSALSFIRLVISIYSSSISADGVEFIIESLVGVPETDRRKFRLKIRDIFASMIRKFGAERVKAFIPREDKFFKIVTNLIKKENRSKRLKTTTKKDKEDKEIDTPASLSLEEILLEIDNELENDKETTKSPKKTNLKSTKKGQTWIKEDEDDIVDLLDLSLGGKVTAKAPRPKSVRFEENHAMTDEDKYGFKVDRKTNKFIITEQPEADKDTHSDNDEDSMVLEDVPDLVLKSATKEPEARKKRKRRLSEDSNVSDLPPTKFAGGDTEKERRVRVKNKFDYGVEFRAKKAKGDVVKKGGIAPYAYVQLSKDKLNRRKRAKFVGQFKSLVKGAKRGAAKGVKMKVKKR